MKLKEEIKRAQAVHGGVVEVNKADYIQMLKELKILRFKVSSKMYWKKKEGQPEGASAGTASV